MQGFFFCFLIGKSRALKPNHTAPSFPLAQPRWGGQSSNQRVDVLWPAALLSAVHAPVSDVADIIFPFKANGKYLL